MSNRKKDLVETKGCKSIIQDIHDINIYAKEKALHKAGLL
tara:strand:+ start:4835 stop:4954 length:120 start_codon:yes stop_codon:yes gene_type:complete